MPTRARFVSALAVAVVLALTATVCLGARSPALAANLVAELSSAQEVPPVPGSSAGVAVMSFDSATSRLFYNIVTNVTSAITGIHIHLSAANATRYLLSVTGSGVTDPLPLAWSVPLLSGGTYMNIHTLGNPSGEVLGQIVTTSPISPTVVATVVAMPLAATNLAAAESAGADGTLGLAVLRFDPATNSSTFNVQFTSPVAVGEIDVRVGTLGSSGAVVCSLGTVLQGQCVTVPASALAAGGLYMTFYQASTGTAVARGQVLPLSSRVGPYQATFASQLIQYGTTASGLVIAAFDPFTGALRYQVWSDATNVTRVSLGLTDLCTGSACVLPLMGVTAALAPADVESLFNGALELRVDWADPFSYLAVPLPYGPNVASSTALVRKYAAVLSNAQEVPASVNATTAFGAALLTIDSSDQLTYAIWVNGTTGSTSAVHVHYSLTTGSMGATTTTRLSFPLSEGFAIGSVSLSAMPEFTLAGGDVLNGFAYVNWHTMPSFSAGELRGQVLALDPQTPFPPTHVATMDGSQEVPAVTASFGSGLAVASLDPFSRRLVCRLVWESLSGNVTAIHIHNGAAGTNGPVVEFWSPPTGTGMTLISAALTANLIAELAAGNLYLNVHTSVYPAGAIRGQLLAPANIMAAVGNAQQELAVSTQVVSSALALAIAAFETGGDGATKLAAYTAVHTFANGLVTAEHLHYGAPVGAAASGPYVMCTASACDYAVDVSGVPVPSALAVNARLALAYLNVHTSTYSAGELRGQLGPLAVTVVPPSAALPVGWMVDLTGAASVPASGSSAVGLASVAFDESTRTLTVSVGHTATGATGLIVGVGAAGAAGSTLATLTGTGAVVTGSFVVPAVNVCSLKSGGFFVAVATSAAPAGAIRAQIDRSAGYTHGVAFASGAQEVPPVASTGAAVAGFKLVNGALVFNVMHSMGYDVSRVHIHAGAFGIAGAAAIFNLGPLAGVATAWLPSPLSGTTPALTGDQLGALESQVLYLNVHTNAAPTPGAARGQIVPLSTPAMCAGPPPPASTQPQPPPPPPPVASTSAGQTSSKTNKILNVTNGIYAAIAFGGLICIAVVVVIVLKIRKSGKKSANYAYGNGTALMSLDHK